jgi:uncharacterized protein DUF3592
MVSLVQTNDWYELAMLAAALALAGVQKVWTGHRLRRSQTWPISYGRIVSTDSSRKSAAYRLKLKYTYRINEELHTGEFRKDFPDEAVARVWGDVLHEKEIAVHYNPTKNADSQLWESDLALIVQSSRLSQRAVPSTGRVLPEWQRLFLVGGLTVATTGLCLSVVAFLAASAGTDGSRPRFREFWVWQHGSCSFLLCWRQDRSASR